MIKLKELPEKLLIGLSGGADSVALLLLLLETKAQVTAVHVNHGLRGMDSDEDEAFVRRLCEDKGVQLLVFRAEPPENASEGWARKVRYGFFRQALQASRAEALVLAHHRDDQAETLLLHLVRGAGLTGLTGMAEDAMAEDMRILRPLLMYSRAELREYLMKQGQGWREDASNADPRYLRNAIRAEVLPCLERLIPGAAERIANTAALLAEDEAMLNSLTAEFLEAHKGEALPLVLLRNQPRGMQRRILRAWWAAHAAPQEERSLSSVQTEALCLLVDASAGAKCNLPGGWLGQSGWTHLHLVPPGEREVLPEVPAEECPFLRVEAYNGDYGDGRHRQAMPASWLTDCTVRSRRKGDYIRPFGSQGKQTLQDYFVNRRVDAAFRDQVPLVCRGKEVLLVGGIGAGAVPCAEDCADPVLIRWTIGFAWE